MTYNQIYDVLTTTSVHFLFAISGHIFKQITHRSFKLAAHSEWESWLYEVLFFGHITIIFLCEGWEAISTLRENRWKLVKAWKAYWNFWNVVDWVSIMLAYAILITWISQCTGQDELSLTLKDPMTELLASIRAAETPVACRAVSVWLPEPMIHSFSSKLRSWDMWSGPIASFRASIQFVS